MENIKLEKFLERLCDHVRAKLPQKAKRSYPALRCVADLMVAVKSENNREIALELGMICEGEWEYNCDKNSNFP